MKLCPTRAHWVADFVEAKAADGKTIYRCPNGHMVPTEFVRDYDKNRITQVSLIGFTQQGKTVYLASVLQELERRVQHWGKYYSTAINAAGWLRVQEAQQRLEKGLLPPHTQRVFPEPVVLQVRNVPKPRIINSRLLLYDTSGSVFDDRGAFEEFGGYALNSPAVLLFIDLLDHSQVRNLVTLLLKYLSLLKDKKIDPKSRTLIVVVTKGDMLRDRADLPGPMREFLDGESDPENADDVWHALERLSDAIERYLDRRIAAFVRQAREELGAVKYCVVSALGAEPWVVPSSLASVKDVERLDRSVAALRPTEGAAAEPDLRQRVLNIEAVSHGVLMPLFWLWGMQHRMPVRLHNVPYYSLAWAIEQAQRNDAIHLGNGRHLLPTTLVIDRPIRLVGARAVAAAGGGERRPVSRLLCNDRGAAVAVKLRDGGSFVAENVSFERHQPEAAAERLARRGPEASHVVVVEAGEVRFQNCGFAGGDWDQAENLPGSGLKFAGNSAGSVSHCQANDNGGFGIHVAGEANVDLQGNHCCHNEHSGIAFSVKATGSAEANTAIDNHVAGILLSGAANPNLGRNTLKPNGETAIQDLRKDRRKSWW